MGGGRRRCAGTRLQSGGSGNCNAIVSKPKSRCESLTDIETYHYDSEPDAI